MSHVKRITDDKTVKGSPITKAQHKAGKMMLLIAIVLSVSACNLDRDGLNSPSVSDQRITLIWHAGSGQLRF